MKLGLVTKLDQRNKNVQKIDDDRTYENGDVIAIFPICRQFGAIWKPDFGHIFFKTYFFINSNLSSYIN